MGVKKAVQLDLMTSAGIERLRPEALGAAEQAAIVRLALDILALRHARGQALSSPKDTCAYLQLMLAERRYEVFCVLYLD